jgi:DNA-binding NtrC family response regulator
MNPFQPASGRSFASPYVVELAYRDDNPLVRLRPGENSLGAGLGVSIVLRGHGVLPRHGTLTVTSSGELHYTSEPGARAHVDGRPVRRAIVSDGSILQIGDDVLVVHRLEPGEDADEAPLPGLRGRSAAMRALARTVERYAAVDLPVLIHGPSGTGKDAVAAAIHAGSAPRGDAPFVVANVASIPRDLCESELFGHARGAFTGAERDHQGLLAQAHGGTLFLDEIGELPIDVQPKLLRALDGYGFRPVGGRSILRPRCRVVTASHVDLRRAVREGGFRNDLLHRLEVLVVRTPSLESRRSDVAAIAYGILSSSGYGMDRMKLAPSALEALVRMTYEGNVRELRNLLLRAAAMAKGSQLTGDDITRADPQHLGEFRVAVGAARAVELLEAAGGNLTRAASRAGVPRTTFRRRVEDALRIGLDRKRPRRNAAREGGQGAAASPPNLTIAPVVRDLGRRRSPLAAVLADARALEVAEQSDDFLTAE